MAVLIGKQTRAIVQGITGNQGSFHTRLMLDYGTRIIAGVTPGKGGTTSVGVPVFDTVASALEKTDANASIIFVPAPYAKEAGMPVVLKEAYSASAPDLSSLVTKLKRARPDVILHTGYTDPALRGRKLDRDLRFLHIENKRIPIIPTFSST